MSELRHDPVGGGWTLIAPERAWRPRDVARPSREVSDPAACPFCPGHEDLTPPTRLALSLEGETGWSVRVFENRFPAVRPETLEDERAIDAPAPYRAQPGAGVHEVIVETRRHEDALADYAPAHAALVVEAYAQRLATLREDMRLAAAVIFRNDGVAAGATLSHPHSQLMALERVPEMLVREIGCFSQAATAGAECVLCDAVAADRADGRTVFDDGCCVAVSTFSAPTPYHMRIAPLRCSSTLADATPDERASFGAALVAAARALRGTLGDVGFNAYLHDEPFSAQRAGLPFHWHADLFPRLGDRAGFEWGSGMALNVIDPDVAAESLRGGLAREAR